jgi:hypothetical protein
MSFRGSPFAILVNPRENETWFAWSEERQVRDALFKVQPGDMVFDVGCGYGAYALSALAVGASHAHCWSLDPAHIEMMAATVALNEWGSRATLNLSGLHSGTGWLSAQGSSHLVSKVPGGHFCESLDEYVARLPREMKLPPFDYQPAARDKTWLLVDTQGDELPILQGARQFIQDYRPTILVKTPDPGVITWLTSGIGCKPGPSVQAYGTWHRTFKP